MERLRKAIENNNTDTIREMIQKDSIDINANIRLVRITSYSHHINKYILAPNLNMI